MYPARYPEVIGVGALTRYGEMAPYNNTGKEVDILAPGSDIISADITNGDPYSGYGKCSGTSQAAAHITAAVALMLATDPSLTPDEIRQILIESSEMLDGAGNPGALDLAVALQQIREGMDYWDQYSWYWNWFRFFRW
jgi:subtilisin